ncbi:type VI secretion system secreted protein VgrG [Plasticicumulans lactativorans]|uniref:Type VI secretion system secreted protein VgrG n=1 Tax=Plasticicumulans lactativorans TaxID=1133106 RepID=A0A4R2KVW7_9GAMM|nr:type VI secretion system tip protein VgrG [Plasticicumulans lactativorans]TCO78094.1 type VI secretion system secreted protein VgrG [Plasticicumulans lactativorans]
MPITQTHRLATVTSPDLAEGTLLLRGMSGRERLSTPFEYELDLVSENAALALADVFGKELCVELTTAGGTRYFHGRVVRFVRVGNDAGLPAFRAWLRPWLWLLTRSADCRIFQEMTVPDIVKQVFDDHGFSDVSIELNGSYRTWEFCVQYRETAFNFVNRLLEGEGIYYFFRHEAGKHTLVLADGVSAHARPAGGGVLPYFPQDNVERRKEDHLYAWSVENEVQTAAVALKDFHFITPSTPLDAVSQGEATASQFELFDYPGEYSVNADGEQYARARLEAVNARGEQVVLRGNARAVGCGDLFEIKGCPASERNIEHLAVEARYALRLPSYEVGERSGGSDATFDVTLVAIDAQTPFRAALETPKPLVYGPQTAIVVGPSGEEIWTDEYGRVKVHFHWDRHDASDEHSSCWIRVSQVWAGAGWGAMHIPRIGQEVIVEFLEGDPDRPIITGRVYNGTNAVPFALPDNKTQSGLRSRSTLQGAAANCNEIRMEDKKGSEHLLVHAEKNQDIEVENDEGHWVGHNRSKTVDNDETVSIGHDRTESVDHNETISIGVDRTESVGKNETVSIGENRTMDVGKDEALTVGQNRTHSVGKDETIDIGQHLKTSVAKNETREVGENRETSIGKDDKLQVSKKFYLEAGDEITLKTGDASIIMKKDGTIQIKGKDITITGSGKIGVKASGDMVLKGSKIAEN